MTITKILVPTVSPDVASDPSVSWTSGDDDVATVANGIVTGIAVGEAYIFATTSDGNSKDSCLVTVSDPTIVINNTEATGFKLYPNPANDILTIENNRHLRLHTIRDKHHYKRPIELQRYKNGWTFSPNRPLIL